MMAWAAYLTGLAIGLSLGFAMAFVLLRRDEAADYLFGWMDE